MNTLTLPSHTGREPFPLPEYSLEEIHIAVRKAARFIEENPHRYSFIETRVPVMDGDDHGCMVAWTAAFLGIPAGCKSPWRECAQFERIMGVNFSTFKNLPNRVDRLWNFDWMSPHWASVLLRLHALENLPPLSVWTRIRHYLKEMFS